LDATVTWIKDLQFRGVADSGYPVLLNSQSSEEGGVGPVELTLMALAGCTAMDVISILSKKKQRVQEFHVRTHADRAETYPKVITRAELEYVVTGEAVQEAALVRAIELSVKQYCPVHAMLARSFPIELSYSILDAARSAQPRLVTHGTFRVGAADGAA
jgi:putative redox protein